MSMTTSSMAPLEGDDALKAGALHYGTINEFAESICHHGDGQDDRGHPLRPCVNCVKVVRHITDLWAERLAPRAQWAQAGQAKWGKQLVVKLDWAYLIAAGQLNPELAHGMEGFGPL